VTTGAAPVGAAYLALSPRHRALLARFAPPVPVLPAPPLWLHACSVGEVGVAKPLVGALRAAFPNLPLLLTCSTATGHALALDSLPDVPRTWFPFDQRAAVARFFEKARPRLLTLIETEVWPNVMREAARRAAPVALVNARISAKHFERYRRHAWLLRPAFERLTAVGAQNDEYAARFATLGVDPARIRITGNTKFDGLTTVVDAAVLARLRRECGIAEGLPVLVFGSTRPGDESLAATCWKTLREQFPDLKLVVAPRHVQRLGEAVAAFDEPLLLRSESRAGRVPKGERVVIVDTLGELVSLYALATVAVIGGSFYAGVNGHNPLESVALGVLTIFGPYMSNFPDPAHVLVRSEGAVRVPAPDSLLEVLRGLLADPGRRAAIGRRGRKAILANQGALQRTVALLTELIAETPSGCR
jgi:3-deoxy-D-manno-octulosonic-acid transferase